MALKLEIEFSGLCMYLHDVGANLIGIVLPDARTSAVAKHADGTKGQPHVGYLRFDLADTQQGSQRSNDPNDPRFEVVYRFDEDELDLGLKDDEGFAQPNIAMPVIERFAPTLVPVPGLFLRQQKPPAPLVMRTILRGGVLDSVPFPDRWRFSTLLSNGAEPYRGVFAGFSTWRREVKDRNDLLLQFKAWDGKVKDEIRLFPKGADRTIRLKIANLCAENPLEWPQLKLRGLPNGVFLDEDFKWFYRLLQAPAGEIKALLPEPIDTLPVPELEQKGPRALGEEPPDCTGAVTTYQIQQ